MSSHVQRQGRDTALGKKKKKRQTKDEVEEEDRSHDAGKKD